MGLSHTFAAPIVDAVTHLQMESTLNVLLFVPFGPALALLLSRRMWVLAPVAAFVASFAIEHAQRYVPGRIPDLQDILWNTIGGIIGAFLAGASRETYRWITRCPADGERDGARTSAVHVRAS